MAVKKFRRGETTYTCRSCNKLTRNTGGDEGQTGLCLDCFDLAGIDNSLTDNGPEDFYGKEDAKRIFTKRPDLVAKFPELAAAVEVTGWMVQYADEAGNWHDYQWTTDPAEERSMVEHLSKNGNKTRTIVHAMPKP